MKTVNFCQNYSHTIALGFPPAVPRVMAMERNLSSSLSTLTCTSTGSPPTNVIWMKDGETLITNGTTYSLTQTLVDRVTSTYNNTLTIEARFADIIGEYSCKVGNSIGTSNVQETYIKGRVNFKLDFDYCNPHVSINHTCSCGDTWP